MAKNYLDTIHDECQILRGVCDHINSLSRAFDMTGNSVMAKELHAMSADIHTAQSNINKAVGKEVHDRCEESHRQVGETLKLVIGAALKG
jgi:hypothetical protein